MSPFLSIIIRSQSNAEKRVYLYSISILSPLLFSLYPCFLLHGTAFYEFLRQPRNLLCPILNSVDRYVYSTFILSLSFSLFQQSYIILSFSTVFLLFLFLGSLLFYHTRFLFVLLRLSSSFLGPLRSPTFLFALSRSSSFFSAE